MDMDLALDSELTNFHKFGFDKTNLKGLEGFFLQGLVLRVR